MALHGYSKAWGSFRLKGFLNVIWYKSQWFWGESSNEQLEWAYFPGSCSIYYFTYQIKFVELGNSHTISYNPAAPAVELPSYGEGGWGTNFLVNAIPLLSTFILGSLGWGREWPLHGGTTVLIFWTSQAQIAWICGEIAVLNCTCA